jgi:hypothetical protein
MHGPRATAIDTAGWANGRVARKRRADRCEAVRSAAHGRDRGGRTRADTQARTCDALYASDRARMTINELGWLRALRRTLG